MRGIYIKNKVQVGRLPERRWARQLEQPLMVWHRASPSSYSLQALFQRYGSPTDGQALGTGPSPWWPPWSTFSREIYQGPSQAYWKFVGGRSIRGVEL